MKEAFGASIHPRAKPQMMASSSPGPRPLPCPMGATGRDVCMQDPTRLAHWPDICRTCRQRAAVLEERDRVFALAARDAVTPPRRYSGTVGGRDCGTRILILGRSAIDALRRGENGRMRWSEFEKLEPRLAELGRVRLCDPGVVLLGTIRRDGSPRLSPVEPLLWSGDLWLSMGWGTRKAADLQRDPRLLVHSIVTSRDGTAGEYKIRGRVVPEDDPTVHRA